MNYEDWIPSYPEVGSKDFQRRLASKQEFKEVKSSLSEDPPKNPGDLFSYQIFDKRFMRIYDKVLMFYEAGAGKTCGYISVTEDYHFSQLHRATMLTDAIIDYYNTYQGTIKEVIILVTGTSLEFELKKQLICRCTPGTYITDSLIKAKTFKSQKNAVTRSVNQWYEISSYEKFYNQLQKLKLTDEQIAKKYNGTLFVCDEIHSIKNSPSGEDETDDDEDVGKKKKKTKLFTLIYETLWKCFHLPEWCKVILATATPMINDADDFIDPMNLILPMDKQIPLNARLAKWSLEKFREYMMGYVSFVRAGDTGVDVEFTGTVLQKKFTRPDGVVDDSQMQVEKVLMSEFQSKVYEEVVKQKRKGVRNDERQASGMVFPDGSFGGKMGKKPQASGIGKYIINPSKNEYKRTRDWNEATNTIAKIERLSCIYGSICRQVLTAPGLCFIYDELLNGSGVIALAMCLESLGFSRFNESFSVFEEKAKKGRVGAYCSDPTVERTLKIKPGLRYAIISSDTKSQDVHTKELFNSPENMYGEYCKVLIGSRVSRDGHNLANVQDVFIASLWTPAGLYQAMQRAIRATSHVQMRKLKNNARITIRVHRMAAVPRDKKTPSVNLDMYTFAETKDRDIAIVRRKVRQIAGDCIIQQGRNIQEDSSMDYTSKCDYDICDVPCYATETDETDYSTFRMFYSQETETRALQIISDMFSFISHFSVPQLCEQYDLDVVITQNVIAKVVQERRLFKNRFGQSCIAALQGNEVYLVPPEMLAGGSSILDNFYSSILIIEDNTALKDFIVSKTDVSRVIHTQQEKQQTPAGNKSVDVNASLMESGLVKTPSQRTTEEKYVVDRYKNYVFELKEPDAEIRKEVNKPLEKGTTRGRKPLEGKIRYLDQELPRTVETGEKVTVHTMYTIPPTLTRYTIASTFTNAKGRLRILKPSEKVGWRDTTVEETVVYNAVIRTHIMDMLQKYTKNKLYGSILSDNVFRIHDLRNLKNTKDKRVIPRGRVCSESWDPDELLLIAYAIGVQAPKLSGTSTMKKEDYVKELIKYKELQKRKKELEKYTFDELKYIYAWMLNRYSRPFVCQQMQKSFKEQGLLFEA